MILVKGFRPLKIKTTQFPVGFRLKISLPKTRHLFDFPGHVGSCADSTQS